MLEAVEMVKGKALGRQVQTGKSSGKVDYPKPFLQGSTRVGRKLTSNFSNTLGLVAQMLGLERRPLRFQSQCVLKHNFSFDGYLKQNTYNLPFSPTFGCKTHLQDTGTTDVILLSEIFTGGEE